jgi:hypothetical protein
MALISSASVIVLPLTPVLMQQNRYIFRRLYVHLVVRAFVSSPH